MADVESWQIEQALRKCVGVMSHAAKQLHVHRNTLHRRLRREPELQQIVFEERETLVDEAESVLLRKLKEDNLEIPRGRG